MNDTNPTPSEGEARTNVMVSPINNEKDELMRLIMAQDLSGLSVVEFETLPLLCRQKQNK